jgi:fused signal recognition particle receptor
MMTTLFDKWKNGLTKTRKVAFSRISTILGTNEITPQTWEDLEALLIQADAGVDTTLSLIKNLQEKTRSEGISTADELKDALRTELISRITPTPALKIDHRPTVVLVVGVNGSGKTTTIAKIGEHYKHAGYKVMFGAADTYRAAAVDQLQVWGDRLGIPVIAGQESADPGAVAYDTLQSAQARNMDIVFIDTAGRLQTRFNLMEELKKVRRVVAKTMEGAPHATWLVLDATTGQNALAQARAFTEAVAVDGIIMAKLDSSAKGGMILSIQKELGLPILFAGLGEKVEDLEVFNRENYVDGILSD